MPRNRKKNRQARATAAPMLQASPTRDEPVGRSFGELFTRIVSEADRQLREAIQGEMADRGYPDGSRLDMSRGVWVIPAAAPPREEAHGHAA